MNEKPRYSGHDTIRLWTALSVALVLFAAANAGQSEPGPPDLPTTGIRNFSIAQYDYLDDGTRLTGAEILDALLLSDISMRAFYREASYDLLDLDVVELVDGITDLHPPEVDCYPHQDYVLIEVDEELEPDPYWPDVDHHLALVNNDCNKNMSSYGNKTGFPTLSHGVQYMPLARTTAKPTDLDPAPGISSSVWAHEIGHGFGIPNHPQAYKCSVNGPLSVNPDDCVNTTHQHDLMGRRHAATRFNGHLKDFFGWLPEASKTTIINDGCYVIDLHDLAQPADPGQTQFVEIPLLDGIPARTAGGLEIDFDSRDPDIRLSDPDTSQAPWTPKRDAVVLRSFNEFGLAGLTGTHAREHVPRGPTVQKIPYHKLSRTGTRYIALNTRGCAGDAVLFEIVAKARKPASEAALVALARVSPRPTRPHLATRDAGG